MSPCAVAPARAPFGPDAVYRNGVAGGGAAGLLAVTGYAAPTATLIVVGAGAALIGALLTWRSVRLGGQDAENAASGKERSRP